MRKEVIQTEKGKLSLEIYDSIEDLPIERFNKFNKYMLVDSGIGSDAGSVIGNITKAVQYIRAKDDKSATETLINTIQGINMISEGINFSHLSFAVLVKSIDGVDRSDITDDGVLETSRLLGGINVKVLDGLLESAQKKNRG